MSYNIDNKKTEGELYMKALHYITTSAVIPDTGDEVLWPILAAAAAGIIICIVLIVLKKRRL